jgi:putative AlgH/UPF0301 family transcriptional regulator
MGKSSLKFETNRHNERATMGVVLESDSEDEEKVLPQKKKKEESSDSEEEAESTDEEGEPKQKKQKTDKKKKKKKKKQDNSDSENSDVIDDLSGDEVDQSNIIAGGRASRSTRPVFTKQMYAAANLEDESEDEECL